MSVLVSDGHSLAADSYANAQGISFPFPKLARRTLPDGSEEIAGVVGPLEPASKLLAWFTSGLKPEDFPVEAYLKTAQLLVLSKDKGAVRYNGSPAPILHGHNKIAIGEGAPFAYGAMFMGASPAQAVCAAMEYCPDCNGHIQRESLP